MASRPCTGRCAHLHCLHLRPCAPTHRSHARAAPRCTLLCCADHEGVLSPGGRENGRDRIPPGLLHFALPGLLHSTPAPVCCCAASSARPAPARRLACSHSHAWGARSHDGRQLLLMFLPPATSWLRRRSRATSTTAQWRCWPSPLVRPCAAFRFCTGCDELHAHGQPAGAALPCKTLPSPPCAAPARPPAALLTTIVGDGGFLVDRVPDLDMLQVGFACQAVLAWVARSSAPRGATRPARGIRSVGAMKPCPALLSLMHTWPSIKLASHLPPQALPAPSPATRSSCATCRTCST